MGCPASFRVGIVKVKEERTRDTNWLCPIEGVAYENTHDVWIPLKLVNFVDTSPQRIH